MRDNAVKINFKEIETHPTCAELQAPEKHQSLLRFAP